MMISRTLGSLIIPAVTKLVYVRLICLELVLCLMESKLQDIKRTILGSAKSYGITVLAIILYGSRARGDYSFDSDYDIFTLLGNRTTLLQFVQFSSEFRMASYRLGPIKMYSSREKDFLSMLTENPYLGAFCYIIATEGIALYENNRSFIQLTRRVGELPPKKRRRCMENCLRMSQRLGSPKWIDFWQKKLDQFDPKKH